MRGDSLSCPQRAIVLSSRDSSAGLLNLISSNVGVDHSPDLELNAMVATPDAYTQLVLPRQPLRVVVVGFRQAALTVLLVTQFTLHCRVSAGLMFASSACCFCCVNAPCPVDRTALGLESMSETLCYEGEYYHARSRGQTLSLVSLLLNLLLLHW